jgi:hypothetical protein
MRTKRFVVTGSMDVQGNQIQAADGSIIGYKQKDGSIIKLVVALEVVPPTGINYKYLVTDKQMRTRGFTIGLYDQADFE